MRGLSSIYKKYLIPFSIILIYIVIFEICLQVLFPDIRLSKYSLFSEKSKLYGWALEPDQYYAIKNPDSGRPIVFRTNSQGWKDVEHHFSTPAYKILIVGDSYTFGMVSLENSFPRILELLFKLNGYNVEVISIGMGGWSTDQEFEVIKNEGMRYKPDLVILDFSFNDSAENLLPDSSEFKYSIDAYKPFKYFVSDGKLNKQFLPREISWKIRFKHIFFNSAIVNRIRLLSMSLKSKLTKPVKLEEKAHKAKNDIVRSFNHFPYDRIFKINGYENSLSVPRAILKLLLKEINEYVVEHNAIFVVYALTGDLNRRKWEIEYGRVIEKDGEDYVYYDDKVVKIDFFYEHKLIRELCEEQGIDIIEPQREYDRYISDPHTNKVGNREMARDVYDFIMGYEPFKKTFSNQDKIKEIYMR